MSKEPEMYPLVDQSDYTEEYESFEELKDNAERMLGSLNFPLSWWIEDETNKYWDEDSTRHFALCVFMPGKNKTTVWKTQVFHRATVQAWLDSFVRANVLEWYGWEER